MSETAIHAEAVQRLLDSRTWTHQGVDLHRGPHGLSMVATTSFAAGSTIYTTTMFTTKPDVDGFRARTTVDGCAEDVIVTAEHMVCFQDARWWDVPGCFINHSCDPNSESAFHPLDGQGMPTVYAQVALKDIPAGSEVTCDYTRFDWGADGFGFDCLCGAPHCLGRIDGFGGLPRAVQESTAHTTSMEARRRWELLLAAESASTPTIARA